MTNPLVSIIIPVYNGANYLREAIDSALAQIYGSCEILVINDGSTDSTEEICLSYGDKIRYFPKENGGVSTALNLGVREMRGEYFTWLAHDDMFYPDKLKLQIAALERSSDKTAIVHGNYNLLNVKRNVISNMRQEDSYDTEQLTNSVFPLLMTTVHASTPLIHKGHFERVGLFDENLPLTQDYDFLFRAMRGCRTIFLPEPLLLSRLHDSSGKNINDRFGRACSEQYKHFADTLTYSEVCNMFHSPRALYCRIAAMMKARCNTPDADEVFSRIAELPQERENTERIALFKNCLGNGEKRICIFGAGYHGKVLKFELEHRGIAIDCFCDNSEHNHGKIINAIPCLSSVELERDKENTFIIIAADVSDAIEAQLSDAGFPHITTKKKLDGLILKSPPIAGVN